MRDALEHLDHRGIHTAIKTTEEGGLLSLFVMTEDMARVRTSVERVPEEALLTGAGPGGGPPGWSGSRAMTNRCLPTLDLQGLPRAHRH